MSVTSLGASVVECSPATLLDSRPTHIFNFWFYTPNLDHFLFNMDLYVSKSHFDLGHENNIKTVLSFSLIYSITVAIYTISNKYEILFYEELPIRYKALSYF
jgi:hypothetical protein